MDEKIIIKSERFNVKKVAAIIVIIGDRRKFCVIDVPRRY